MGFHYTQIVYFAIIHGVAHSTLSFTLCPSMCHCHYEDDVPVVANCSGRGLVSVPRGLPSSLKRLVLANNNITHLQCRDFCQMSQLKYLDLSLNKIQTIESKNTCHVRHPEECCMTKLSNPGAWHRGRPYTILNMHKPDCHCHSPFSHLTELEVLHLSSNKLSNLSSCGVSGLPKLVFLGLGSNSLRKLDRFSFQGLYSLKKLDIQIKTIADPIPEDIFQDLTNLTELNLKFYSLSECYPDQALSRLTSLKQLRMNGLKSPCVLGFGFRNLSHLDLLDFSENCYIDSLPENFFSNISTKVNISIKLINCKIESIHPETFSHLPTLVKLDLSNNDQLRCYNAFLASRSFPKTRIQEYITYNINNKPFVRLTSGTFKYIGNTTLKALDLSHYLILTIDLDVPGSLPRTLEVLKLSQNCLIRASFMMSIAILTNLKVLDTSRQNNFHVSLNTSATKSVMDSEICHIIKDEEIEVISSRQLMKQQTQIAGSQFSNGLDEPQQYSNLMFIQKEIQSNGGNWSYRQWTSLVNKFCPSLKSSIPHSSINSTAIHLTQRIIQHMVKALLEKRVWLKFYYDNEQLEIEHDTFPIPRSLEIYYASQMKLGYAIPSFGVEENVLWYLDVSQNFLWCFDGPLWGFNALKYLDLSRNFAWAISPYFFQETRNISHLVLTNNKLAASLELDVEGKTFSFLEHLETLELTDNGLRILHRDALRHNTELRHLHLAQNNLRDLPDISGLQNLQYINVSYNIIQAFSWDTMQCFDKITLSSNVSVDLRHNPLACDCSSQRFLFWFKKTKVSFVGGHNYTCSYLNSTHFRLIDIELFSDKLWRTCQGENFFLVSSILFLLFVLIFVSYALTSYFSYRLLFYIYLSKQRFFHHLYKQEKLNVRDVFLVYDDQNIDCRRHVQQIVIPHLISQGLTFHLSELGLDNPSAGRSIREVVEESVLGGRKTVVLLTEEIFLDEDKQLEVGMAKIAEEMLGTNRLLFLAVQKINPKTLPAHIYRLLKASRILSYSPGNEQFWKSLARKIKS